MAQSELILMTAPMPPPEALFAIRRILEVRLSVRERVDFGLLSLPDFIEEANDEG